MRRASVLLSAVIALPTAAHPQASGEIGQTPRKPQPTPKARVTGHVLCNDTRQPARGAVVMLQAILPADKAQSNENQQPGRTFTARTGLDGLYSVEHVPAGDYGVIAYLPGYLSPLDDLVLTGIGSDMNKLMQQKLSANGLTHVGADGTETADITIERGATISGRVLYVDGSPATQVNIELQETHANPPRPGEQAMNLGGMYRRALTQQSSGTDDQGHFRISGIHPGTYRVAAIEPPSMPDSGGGDGLGLAMSMGMGMLYGVGNQSVVRFYTGDTIHQRAAKTYELRAGDTVADLDIRLPIDGFHTVQVRLSTPGGGPVNMADVTLVDNADDSLHFRASPGAYAQNGGPPNPEGIFLFHQIPPGTYTLSVKSALIFHSTPMPAQNRSSSGIGAVSGGSSETQFTGSPMDMFSDTTSAVIVKDSDPPDINLTLSPAKPATH